VLTGYSATVSGVTCFITDRELLVRAVNVIIFQHRITSRHAHSWHRNGWCPDNVAVMNQTLVGMRLVLVVKFHGPNGAGLFVARHGNGIVGVVRVAVVVMAVLLVAVVVAPATPAGAQQPPPASADASAGAPGPDGAFGEAEPADPAVPPIEKVRPSIRWWVRTLDAASADLRRLVVDHAQLVADLNAHEVALAELQEGGLAVAQQRIDRLVNGIADAEQRRDAAEARAVELEAQRKQVAVGLYLTGPVQQLDYAGALGHSSSLDRTRAMVAVNSGVGATREKLDQQRAEAERYERAAQRRRQALDAERDGVSAIQAESDRIVARMFELQAAIEGTEQDMAARTVQATQAQDLIVFLLMSAGSPAHRAIDPTLSIVGPSVLSAEQLTAWFVTHNGGEADIERISELAGLYVEEGTAIGVRGDVAFVQAVLETGGFRFTGSHNYAGIGHCDSCPRGFGFDSARQGVRAQVQLLRAYADRDVTPELLPGGPVPGVDVSNLGVKGCCVTWWGLTGVWATALHYGGSILKLYEAATSHAAFNAALNAAAAPDTGAGPPTV
jgi:hypothetical protein